MSEVKPQNVLISGASLFLKRHAPLFEELQRYFSTVQFLPGQPFSGMERVLFRVRAELYSRIPRSVLAGAERVLPLSPWDPRVYRARSLAAESRIRELSRQPDLVFHVFGMYAPFWNEPTVTYVTMLDYTAALARRNYPEWAPFSSGTSWKAWQKCERRGYAGAAHLFTFGRGTRDSLVEDYSIPPEKITVIGSGGAFRQVYSGEKKFGSRRLLFYCADGPEFLRKGGDRVLSAFRIVRERIPQARLAIVGKATPITEPGVENYGFISSPQKMQELFLSSDLVLAPARCDPFPGFLIEAMNFGVPCVVADADGMPEIVDHQLTGLVLVELSGDRLATEVLRLLLNPVRLGEMSEAGLRKVRARLNWSYIAELVAAKVQSLPELQTAPAHVSSALASPVINTAR